VERIFSVDQLRDTSLRETFRDGEEVLSSTEILRFKEKLCANMEANAWIIGAAAGTSAVITSMQTGKEPVQLENLSAKECVAMKPITSALIAAVYFGYLLAQAQMADNAQ
jgi:hypothetical protein